MQHHDIESRALVADTHPSSVTKLSGNVDHPVNYAGKSIGHVDFRGARFRHAVSFRNCRFGGVAWFDGAVFESGVDAFGAMFENDLRCDEVRFLNAANFSEAEFRGVACFDGAAFFGPALFEAANFCASLSLDECRFENRLSLCRANCWGGLWAKGCGVQASSLDERGFTIYGSAHGLDYHRTLAVAHSLAQK